MLCSHPCPWDGPEPGPTGREVVTVVRRRVEQAEGKWWWQWVGRWRGQSSGGWADRGGLREVAGKGDTIGRWGSGKWWW